MPSVTATRTTPATPSQSYAAASTGPAPGTTSQNVGQPASPPHTNAPGQRSRSAYDQVIDQFAVHVNARYAIRDTSGDGVDDTFCNIFAWDVMSAMGVQLPHWTYRDGAPAPPGYGNGGFELDANSVNSWLNNHGAGHGWKKVSADEAQALANQGMPVVASQKNPGGIGHIGVVRPGEATNGPALAQAGAQNFNKGHVYDTFTPGRVEFWVNTTGGSPTQQPAKPVDPVTQKVPQVDLAPGSTGDEVKKLQTAMVRLGYLSSEKMATGPGIYGPATTAAVQAFQSANGISGTGGYGPKTRAALMGAIAAKEPKAVAPAPPLLRGDEGPRVNQLKVALYRLGYISKAMLEAHPDELGSGTEAALKRFQQDHGLKPSGKYGTGSEANLKAALKKLPGAGASAAATPPPGASTAGQASAAKIDTLVRGTGLAGQGANIARYAKQYGVPAELALAMFWHEAQFNSTGIAPRNNNPGNLRFVGQPGAVSGVSGFAKWPTVGQGVEAYFKLMSTVYRGFIDRRDWAGLVHKYAPASDGNDEAQYVRRLVEGMNAYRAKIY